MVIMFEMVIMVKMIIIENGRDGHHDRNGHHGEDSTKLKSSRSGQWVHLKFSFCHIFLVFLKLMACLIQMHHIHAENVNQAN